MNLTHFNRCVHPLYWSHAQTQAKKKSQQKCGFHVVFLISHQDKIHFFSNGSSIFIILCFSSIDLEIFPARW